MKKYYIKTQPDGIVTDALTYAYDDYTEVNTPSLPREILSGWYRWDGQAFTVDEAEYKRLNKGEVMAKAVNDLVIEAKPDNAFVEAHYKQIEEALELEWEENPNHTYPAKTVLKCDNLLWRTPTGALAIANYRPGMPGTIAVWAPNTRPKDLGAMIWLTGEHLPGTGYERISPSNGKTYINTMSLPDSTNNHDPANFPAGWREVK